jgi:hypothetical protein
MSADVLKRIEQLIALAASPEVEEARSAAFAAAKLIREHAVKLSVDSAAQPSPKRGAERPKSTAKMTEPRVITAKYPGRCRRCGTSHGAGDQVRWMAGIGACHVACEWKP